MRCEAFEDRLNAVLDQRQRPEWDAELAQHTAGCPACRQLAAAYQILLDGFYELAAPEPPADLAQRVLERRSQLRRATVRWRVAVPSLAIAAAVLVAVIPLLRSGSQVTTASSKPTTTRQLGPGTLSHLPILPQDWIEAPDPYEGLAKGTGQNLAAVMLYVPGIAGTKGIIDAETEASEGEPSWADQMSEGLKPVSDSVAETINLILESLPVNQLASRS